MVTAVHATVTPGPASAIGPVLLHPADIIWLHITSIVVNIPRRGLFNEHSTSVVPMAEY
jgi:hypothetical protein